MPLHNHFFAYDDQNDDDAISPISLPPSSSSGMVSSAKETDRLLPSSNTMQKMDAKSEIRTLTYACALTTFFFFVELVGGHLAGSLAIMSDAAHLLSDLAGFMISLIAVSVSHLPPNAHMTFGFARAEVLGAFVSILFIWALTIVLVIYAIERLFNPKAVNASMMLVLGVIGLFVNITLGCVLGHGGHSHSHSHGGHNHDHAHHDHVDHTFVRNHSVVTGDTGNGLEEADLENGYMSTASNDARHAHCHDNTDEHTNGSSHGHDHDHGHAHEHPDGDPQNDEKEKQSMRNDLRKMLALKEGKSANIRAAYLHVLGDALQNIGVITAAIVMIIKPSWAFFDPLCTLLFAVIVIMTTRDLARETMTVLMEGTPASLQLEDVHARLLELEGVSNVGDLHVWSITARRPALSVHLYQKNEATGHDIVKDAQRMLARDFGILHATIQVNCETVECCDEVLFEADSSKNDCVSYRPKNGKSASS
ncbi:Cation efflux protein [Gracilaria domingensis]|nr:Cation efflux protein [Gracilaria domingensis]